MLFAPNPPFPSVEGFGVADTTGGRPRRPGWLCYGHKGHKGRGHCRRRRHVFVDVAGVREEVFHAPTPSAVSTNTRNPNSVNTVALSL